MSVAVVADVLDTCAPGYSRRFLQSMALLWKETCFCDVTIIIGKRHFLAHKAVLAAASPFFKAMFTSGMEEERSNEIVLHEMSAHIFNKILSFMYTGDLHVDTDTCQDLLGVADMLELGDVVNICCDFLVNHLSPHNCVGIYVFADLHNFQSLKHQAELHLEKNFSTVGQGEEFLEMELEYVLPVLGSERLHIERESQVLEAAVNWMLFDLPSRRKHLLQVLNKIRVKLISHKYLFNIIDSCPDHGVKITLTKLASSSETLKTLNPNSLYVSVPKLNSLTCPRENAKKYIYVVGGFARNKSSFVSSISTLDSIERFDIHTRLWQSFKGMCHPRSSHGIAILDRRIVVAGGEDASLISDSVESFDPDENYWTPLPSMKHPRYGLGLVSLEGCLYAIGGYVGTQVGGTVERWDTHTRTWELVDSMPTARFALGTVEWEGLIYVVGGLTEMYTESDAVESYNPVTREWTTLARMKVPRAYHGVVALDGCLYVVGGFNEYTGSLRTMEKYSIQDNTWTTVTAMDMSRAGAGIAVMMGLIYVFGGRSQDAELSGQGGFCASVTLDTAECYNPRTDQWSSLPRMTYERCETMAVVL